MDIDACVLCNAHSYSDLSPDEILANTSDYDSTFTWEHWGEESHQWQLAGYQVFSSNDSLIPRVIVFYYTPCDKDFIENWMGINQS